MAKRKLKFGIFGNGVCNRGQIFTESLYNCGAEVTAFCDIRGEETFVPMRETVGKFGNTDLHCYTEFDEFIKEDLDAVILCNYFSEHAPFAIKALRAGKHVLTECTPNVTLAQGVALCRAVEETGKTFALLENYPCFKSNMAMEKLYKDGTLGKLVYGEGAYIHPMSPGDQSNLAPGLYHWRNWTPRTFYLTHALCPVLQMTDTLPKRVTAMASFAPEIAVGSANRTGDAAAIVMVQTDNDAVLRVTGWANYAPHGNEYKLCCTKGGVFNDRDDKLRIQYIDKPEGVEHHEFSVEPEWPDPELGEIAAHAGHGGGDFWVIYKFVKNLEEGTEPYWNVYRSTMVSSVAILAWRSILNNNQAFDIPDFRKEEDKRKYEFDNVSPYPDENGIPDIPCSSKPYAPTEEGIQRTLSRYPGKPYVKAQN